MKHTLIVALALICTMPVFAAKGVRHYNLADYGVVPGTGNDMAQLMAEALERIAGECAGSNDSIVITMQRGRYDIHADKAVRRTYYISNHDQPNPKPVGICLEGWRRLTLDGKGADLMFHGRMLPLSLVGSTNVTIKNLSIDFDTPHITQVTVVENDTVNGVITYRPAPWVKWRVDGGRFISYGEGWQMQPCAGIAFDGSTRHLVYRTSDIGVGTSNVTAKGDLVVAPWNDRRLKPGTVVAMRDWTRPAPGVFLHRNVNTKFCNVSVHYAEGMGLLAQMCENISLDHFSVCLRGKNDPRYFTTQADATHFSGCKGHINSVGGLYEGMMDDAINIHGTYLKVVEHVDDHTLVGRYMHEQTYGFFWGMAGDEVQFVSSRTMELLDGKNTVKAIVPVTDAASSKQDAMGVALGNKEFRITFDKPLPAEITPEASIGIENLTWTPSVYFARNTVRNNRARGALFSTPRRTLVEKNLFDHTSGTAILLCGDCNGWFETGACCDVTIRNNRFINALTNMFQFTNGIISIYPEIPNLDGQRRYFHSGIVIEGNTFVTFDKPILYAKSVDGLVFRKNKIRHNNDFPAFHPIQQPYKFDRVINYTIEGM